MSNPETPHEHTPIELSKARAKQILNHVMGKEKTQFGENDTNKLKRRLAMIAVEVLKEDKEIPEDFKERLDMLFPIESVYPEKRVGKKISPERAKELLDHLDDKLKDPHWRSKDTLSTKRSALREAASRCMEAHEKTGDDITKGDELLLKRTKKELKTGVSPEEIMLADLRKIDRKYPLAA